MLVIIGKLVNRIFNLFQFSLERQTMGRDITRVARDKQIIRENVKSYIKLAASKDLCNNVQKTVPILGSKLGDAFEVETLFSLQF